MAVAAQLFVNDPAERRGAERRTLMAAATLRAGTASAINVFVHDLSRSGCLIETDAELAIWAPVRIGIVGVPVAEARVVRRMGKLYGCWFVAHLSDAQVMSAGAVETMLHSPVREARLRAAYVEDLQGSDEDDPVRLSLEVRVFLLWGGVIALAALVLVVAALLAR